VKAIGRGAKGALRAGATTYANHISSHPAPASACCHVHRAGQKAFVGPISRRCPPDRMKKSLLVVGSVAIGDRVRVLLPHARRRLLTVTEVLPQILPLGGRDPDLCAQELRESRHQILTAPRVTKLTKSPTASPPPSTTAIGQTQTLEVETRNRAVSSPAISRISGLEKLVVRPSEAPSCIAFYCQDHVRALRDRLLSPDAMLAPSRARGGGVSCVEAIKGRKSIR